MNSLNLTRGQRLTVLHISESSAVTHRYELEVRQALAPEPVGYGRLQTRVAIVRLRHKRKTFYLDVTHDDIILDGWGQPFQTDMEAGGVFAGNACFNLVGDPDTIRNCLETKSLAPLSDSAKAKIIVTRHPRDCSSDDGQELLYPEIETHHAVVNRLKAALSL